MAMSDEETLAQVSLTPTYKIYYDIKSICNVSRTIPQSDAVTDQRMGEERTMCEEEPPTKPIHLDIRLRLLGAIPEEVEESEPALSEILPSWRRPTLAQLMSDRLRAACHGHMRDEEQVNCLLGRCWKNRRSQNLGIAKKGSDPCQDFFGGFDILYRDQP